jgi:hypothetical protein
MERTHRKPGSTLRAFGLAVPAAAALALLGCGGEDDYANNPRPPAPINVAAYVSAERVSVSPDSFGAGPIVVIVTNQSNSSQEVTFETSRGASKEIVQSTSPINPGDTGQLKLDVREGTYVVKAGDDAIRPARVRVGPRRPSAQDELLQP